MTSTTLVRIAAAVLLASGAYCPAAQQDQETPTAGRESPTPTGLAGASNQEKGRPALERRDPRYRLRKGDVLELNFPFSPEFNRTVTVLPDGYVTLRGLREQLHVEGQTKPQLTEMVRNAYADMLHDPIVSIDLKDFQKPYFTALGHFGHPGKFDMREHITVTEAVAIAGGFDSTAKPRRCCCSAAFPTTGCR